MKDRSTLVSWNTDTGGGTSGGEFMYDTTRIVDFDKRKWCGFNIGTTNADLAAVANLDGYSDYLTAAGNTVTLNTTLGGGKFDSAKHEIILVRPKMVRLKKTIFSQGATIVCLSNEFHLLCLQMAMMSSAILCTKPGLDTVT